MVPVTVSEKGWEYGFSRFAACSCILIEPFATRVYSGTICVCFKNLYLTKTENDMHNIVDIEYKPQSKDFFFLLRSPEWASDHLITRHAFPILLSCSCLVSGL